MDHVCRNFSDPASSVVHLPNFYLKLMSYSYTSNFPSKKSNQSHCEQNNLYVNVPMNCFDCSNGPGRASNFMLCAPTTKAWHCKLPPQVYMSKRVLLILNKTFCVSGRLVVANFILLYSGFISMHLNVFLRNKKLKKSLARL